MIVFLFFIINILEYILNVNLVCKNLLSPININRLENPQIIIEIIKEVFPV